MISGPFFIFNHFSWYHKLPTKNNSLVPLERKQVQYQACVRADSVLPSRGQQPLWKAPRRGAAPRLLLSLGGHRLDINLVRVYDDDDD